MISKIKIFYGWNLVENKSMDHQDYSDTDARIYGKCITCGYFIFNRSQCSYLGYRTDPAYWCANYKPEPIEVKKEE